MAKLKLIPFVFMCVGVFASMVFAGGLPEVSILHEASTYFVTESRLFLSAQLNDISGISEARCYFKAGSDTDYLYVPMENSTGNTYECVLPTFKTGVQTLEYFFLIADGKGLLIRSTPYTASEIANTTVPQALSSDASLSILPVYSEIGGINKEAFNIVDEQTEFTAVQDVSQLYGLRAGIYSSLIIPDSLNGVSGYFGGFVIDENNKLVPVKGVAPNLGESILENKNQVEPDPTKGISPESTSTDASFKDSSTSVYSSAPPPDIGGDNWVGYFIEGNTQVKTMLSASIILTEQRVTITTSLTGLGHLFVGTINSRGDMLLYDQSDGEDWTTHYGPATADDISIYDFVRRPTLNDPEPPLNEIVLTRRAFDMVPSLYLLL